MSVPMLAVFFSSSLYSFFFARFGIKREFHGWENFQCKDKQRKAAESLRLGCRSNNGGSEARPPACSRVNEKTYLRAKR